MKTPEPSDAMFALLLTAMFILVTTVLTKAQDVFSLRQLVMGLILTITILVISMGLALATSKNQHQNELNDVIGQLKELVPQQRSELDEVIGQLKELVPRTDFKWLYSDAEFAKAESKAKGDSIWIISPDLSNVTEKRAIIEAVRKNVNQRGITYTYIVPDDTDKIEGVLPALDHVFNSHRERLKLIRVKPDQFRLLAVSHIAVFDAGISSSMSNLEVFIELPIEADEGKKVRGYWIKVESEAAKNIAGRFRRIVVDSNNRST